MRESRHTGQLLSLSDVEPDFIFQVYAASDYAADGSIDPHSEMSHTTIYPNIVRQVRTSFRDCPKELAGNEHNPHKLCANHSRALNSASCVPNNFIFQLGLQEANLIAQRSQ